jgi:HAMP domain-containing protein
VSLRSMLAVPMAVIMLITVVLVAVLSVGSIRSWQDGQSALGRMEQLRRLMAFEEAFGEERSPTNTALSAPFVVTPELGAAIALRRRISDLRLREFATLPGVSDRVRAAIDDVSTHLSAARANADAVLRQAPERRSDFDIRAGIEEMVALPSLLFPTVDQMLAEMTAADPTLATLLTATRTASDLRLYAGSIAARFKLVMARRQPIAPHDLDQILIQQGRIIELHLLLLGDIGIADVAEQIRDVVQSMEGRYFGTAQRVIDQMISTGVSDGKFSLTQQEFIAHYVPGLAPLSAVRDSLFALTRQKMQANQAARLHWLEVTVALGGAVLLAVLAALLMLHRWIIRPLAELAAMIIRLAHGDRSVRWTARHGSQEIAELANAIEVLRVATIEADAAAARRRVELQRWAAQLRLVLDTIDLMHTRTATITDVLPALLEQLGTLAQGTLTQGTLTQGTMAQGTMAQGTMADGEVAAPPGLALAIAATHAGIDVLRNAGGRLDAALRRMHSVGDGEDIRIDELNAAMDEVAGVVTAIQEAVNGVPHITLSAMRDLSAQTSRFNPPRGAPVRAVHERILAQVQEMAAAAGGLQSALTQATHGLGELARLRA